MQQQMGQAGEFGNTGQQRAGAVVQTPANPGRREESLAEVAHDARNMVTALGLYCDLLDEPGVLAVPFAHYGNELRLVAAASRRLVEKLVTLDNGAATAFDLPWDSDAAVQSFEAAEAAGWEKDAESSARADAAPDRGPGGIPGRSLDRRPEHALEEGIQRHFDPSCDRSAGEGASRRAGRNPGRGGELSRRWEAGFAEPVDDLAAELLASRNLLAALAGPGVVLTVAAKPGAHAVRLTAENLTRVLVNLVKNAAEAVGGAAGRGSIEISLERRAQAGLDAEQVMHAEQTVHGEQVVIIIEDNGPGIAPPALDRIFESGFTTHAKNATAMGGWPSAHRGLGLAITRSIVAASGGRITASNRAQGGARFEIELPVQTS